MASKTNRIYLSNGALGDRASCRHSRTAHFQESVRRREGSPEVRSQDSYRVGGGDISPDWQGWILNTLGKCSRINCSRLHTLRDHRWRIRLDVEERPSLTATLNPPASRAPLEFPIAIFDRARARVGRCGRAASVTIVLR
jgi:hypothetical protein